MNLVIVESATKAKTIEKYLGKGYKVLASNGHVRDLPEKNIGVDIKNNFTPKYVVNQKSRETIKKLTEACDGADTVYLATDPDREGEAISWHLAHILKLPLDAENRIEFNEITKSTVQNAISNPRTIDINLVDAQQARRVLDRLVGYKLSPILCKRIASSLSAGRVQSVALRLIVEKERIIRDFKPEEYWTITAVLFAKGLKKTLFKAILDKRDNKKFVPKNKAEAEEVLDSIKGKPFFVDTLKETVTKTGPFPPYTTSTLQQDASNKLGLGASVTMRVAQQLYEGINIQGEGHVALISYIRTDSVRISDDAYKMANEFIIDKFGKEYLPSARNVFKNKKSAQDAHEAIRPISLERTPKSLEGKLDRNQQRLYRLIFERFVASQMCSATFNSVFATISCDKYTFKTSGKTPLFKGCLAAFSAMKDISDEDKEIDAGENSALPKLAVGQELLCDKINSEQKFTKPPLRYTDASLIKALEEQGIGRPSTYATILSVLQKRQYTVKEGKFLVPTDVAFNVIDFLIKYFPDIVNVDFTAKVEDSLDDIEQGGIKWQEIVGDFYGQFAKELEFANENSVEESDVACPKCGTKMVYKVSKSGKFLACPNADCKHAQPLEEDISDVICEKCGARMVYRHGKYGKFLACPNYPECKNIKSINEDEETDEVCEKCGSKMIIKNGKFGKYLACSNYPDCKNTRSLAKAVIKCPKCGKDVIERRSKKTGKIFYGCTGYPDCDFVAWDMPTDKKCPTCGSILTVKEINGFRNYKCINKDCDYKLSEKL